MDAMKPNEDIQPYLPKFPEWQQELFEKYPSLFRDLNRPMTETCMCWGLECGEGWKYILDDLFSFLVHLPQRWVRLKDVSEDGIKSAEYGPLKVVLDQVKQKYGTLRVYYHIEDQEKNPERFDEEKVRAHREWINDYVDGGVALAETISEKTSELSGKRGTLRTEGWWVVLTDEEHEQSLKK